MALSRYGSSSKSVSAPGVTEFEILKASHKFLRDGDEEKSSSWNEQLAAKYYANLYREFAVCDLKHYKSGNFALRWRTEAEVLSGAGETTCGNTRCERHSSGRSSASQLTTLELPFAYEEQGENKSALVKVVLCSKCVKKLMWKRTKEKEKGIEQGSSGDQALNERVNEHRKTRRQRKDDKDMHLRKSNSRSRSPRRKSAPETTTLVFKRSPS